MRAGNSPSSSTNPNPNPYPNPNPNPEISRTSRVTLTLTLTLTQRFLGFHSLFHIIRKNARVHYRLENSAPRGGPQLELFPRRLKTWSKSDPSAALVQPLDNPPCIYIYMKRRAAGMLNPLRDKIEGTYTGGEIARHL